MEDEELLHDGPPHAASEQQRSGGSDHNALSSTHPVPQDAPASTSSPTIPRWHTWPNPWRLLWVAMMVVVLVVLAGGYGVYRAVSSSSRQATPAFQQETPCPFRLGTDLVEAKSVTCGFLTVPEDWSRPQGSTIRLAVAILKTSSPRPAPDPVLFLGGGPGEAVLETVGPIFLPNRDLILLDQRGTGYSQPSLDCSGNPATLLFLPSTPSLRACYTRWVKSGINLNDFTTLENAADVHALIHALGYRQVNLDGVSYGTRLALTVMRLYPADVRSVVLNSAYPPQVNLFTSFPQATERAFDVLFQGCAIDSYCNTTYPHLQAVFYQLVTSLNTRPITFQATPPGDKPLTVHFSGNDLVLWLRQALYSTALIPSLPETIYQIRQHDYTHLASFYGDSLVTTDSIGLFYSVECGEDMAFTTQPALKTSVQGLPPQLQPALLDTSLSRFSICQFWGMKPVPASQKEPVRSSIPTLILQGEYDPVTPPANGMLAAQTLSKSYFFLFPGVTHGVSSLSGCPDAITNAFWENPGEKPNASCISSMPEPPFI